MAIDLSCKYNILLIQTDKYSGNFEVELVDYIVGNGPNVAYKNSDGDDMFDTLDGILECVNDEYGQWVIGTMMESENHTYNDVGIFFNPDIEISKFKYLQMFKDRAIKFGRKNKIKIVGFKIVEIHPVILTSDEFGKNTKVTLDSKRVRGMMVAR
jgi:hypothetical protein